MPRTTAFVSILALAFLAGCGSKDEKPAAQQQAVENNYQGGECGDRVKRDYRQVTFRCDRSQFHSRANVRKCQQEANSFLEKYPAIDCVAKRRIERNRDGDRDYRIEAREIREILERIERMGRRR